MMIMMMMTAMTMWDDKPLYSWTDQSVTFKRASTDWFFVRRSLPSYTLNGANYYLQNRHRTLWETGLCRGLCGELVNFFSFNCFYSFESQLIYVNVQWHLPGAISSKLRRRVQRGEMLTLKISSLNCWISPLLLVYGYDNAHIAYTKKNRIVCKCLCVFWSPFACVDELM